MYFKKSLCLLGFASVLSLAAADILLDTAGKQVEATDFIPVKAGTDYEFSCSAEGGTGRLSAVIHQFDKNRKKIGFHNISGAAETYTTLLKPAVKGEKFILVADASKWDIPKKGRILAFGAKADGSDLPNRSLCYYIKQVSKEQNGYKIELDRPLFFSSPDRLL